MNLQTFYYIFQKFRHLVFVDIIMLKYLQTLYFFLLCYVGIKEKICRFSFFKKEIYMQDIRTKYSTSFEKAKSVRLMLMLANYLLNILQPKWDSCMKYLLMSMNYSSSYS